MSVEKERPTQAGLSREAIFWIAGSVVGVAAVLLAGVLIWPRGPRANVDAAKTALDAPPTVAAIQPAAERGAAQSAVSVKKGQTADDGPKVPSPPTVSSRLAALGARVAQYRVKQGHFPLAAPGRDGLPQSERLSWLAELVATVLLPDRPGPSWGESWRSPLNERFVRQRIPEFLNPSVDRLTGAENYPATHFAGVAGVGADAADLPIGHPRAGIFGNGRSTRLEDIRDGASNTLMVVGVTGELGSWAAAGTPTVRALTREPYINGPDGIGTGSADRMMVLKADGSVQEFSTATDPRILRRMAAMADGLPLDPKVPGEPGEKSPQPPAPDRLAATVSKPNADVAKPPERAGNRTPVVAAKPAAKKLITPPAAPAPKVDLSAALGQRIVRFAQDKPVPLRDVLNILEELVTVPIRGDRHQITDLDDLLQTPISLDLQNTTVAAILEAVLARAKLTYHVQADAIQLQKLGAEPQRAAAP